MSRKIPPSLTHLASTLPGRRSRKSLQCISEASPPADSPERMAYTKPLPFTKL